MMPVLGSERSAGVMELLTEDLAVILGSIGGFLVVVAAVVSYCYCHSSRRRAEREQGNAEKVESGVGCSGSLTVKTSSLSVEDIEGGSCYDSSEGMAKNDPQIRDDSHLAQVSDATPTLIRGHERKVSVHSGPITYDVDVTPLDAPFPDVTMTDYQRTPDGGGEELPPPAYLPCLPEVSCHFTVPGPDYVSYTTAWDEPLTGHLLSHARTVAPTPASHQPHLPQGDRKRRNVTQV